MTGEPFHPVRPDPRASLRPASRAFAGPVVEPVDDRVFDRSFVFLAVLFLLGLTLGQVYAPVYLPLAQLFMIAPLSASLFLTWRPVLVLGLAAVALALVTGIRPDPGALASVDVDDLIRVGTVALGSAFAVGNAVSRARRERALLEMSEVARVAQETIIKPLPREVAGFRLASSYASASSSSLVGGDLYAAVDSGDAVTVLIGDVRGKGLEAVGTAASTIGAFRAFASRADGLAPDLAELAADTARLVAPELGDEDFVTLVIVQVRRDGRARFVSFGHPPPILLDAAGRTREVLSANPHPPLGVLLDVPPVEELLLAAGDRLVLYTDGVMEARDARGEFFALAEAVAGTRSLDADAAAAYVVGAAELHSRSGLNDDVAVVVLDLPDVLA